MSGGTRIDFASAEAGRFNALRDQWRTAAASRDLSRSAMRIATVLPTYVSREFGYAFPTDDNLRDDLNASRETVKRGLKDLETADLIERVTKTKRSDDGRTPGKERRIFLTMPNARLRSAMNSPKGQAPYPPMGQISVSPKGQTPKGQVSPMGQKRPTDGPYGGANIPDRTTPDKETSPGRIKVSSPVHVREARTRTRVRDDEAPAGWAEDRKFLEDFDNWIEKTAAGREIAAGELDEIVAKAFDVVTFSNSDNMPFGWADAAAVRGDPIRSYFLRRAAALVHQRDAA